MVQSSFVEYLNKYFPGITIAVVEKLNDTKRAPTYLHKTMLRPDYSITGKWESLNAQYSRVAADIVSMDSQLPLKKRDSLSRASGDIPKQGMKLWLNENQLTQLQTLVAVNASRPDMVNQILSKIFADVPRAVEGVYERNEAMFLEGLSTGVTLVEDVDNVGTGIRLDFGYLSDNKFGVAEAWGATTVTPFDDIQKVLDKATNDGNTISKIMLSRNALNNILKTTQAKELFAFSVGFVGQNIPSPDIEQINRLTQGRYGFVFEVVDRAIRYEKDGKQTVKKPWQDDTLVFLTSNQVGTLTYATLAEENSPVAGVSYQKADRYILVSKYRVNDPLSEFTTSQARVLPVIGNVDQIYLLNSKEEDVPPTT